VPPRNGTEQFLADALAQVLGSGNISVDDHFFEDLGANSLLMARLCARIRTRKPWAAASMRDIYLHPTVARLAKHLHVPQGETAPLHEPACVHQATNFAYWACGSAQMLFYGLYGYAGVWTLNLGLSWVYGAIGDPAQFFLRSLAFWAAMFFGMTGVAIAAKWALAGRWTPGKFPIWGLSYYRFWVVKTLIQTAPAVMFRGGPLYNVYLRLLGARIGAGAVIKCRSVPVCTDMVSIGANTIIRKESKLLSYRAQSGYIHVEPVTIGRDAFVGVGSVLDIGTKIGDGAQLGHASSLQTGQSIPDGECWHGSPAVPATADYCDVRGAGVSKLRPILFETFRLLTPVAVLTPLLLLGFHGYGQIASGAYLETLGTIAIGAAAALFGFIAAALLAAVAVPRLVRPFLKPGRTYHLYGFRYWLYITAELASNSRLLNLLFGDSSAIVHYIRAIGWKLNKVEQTGSNFGTNQQHESPVLCEIGSHTMVSDGLFMINSHKSATAFRLEHTKIGESNFLGNNIYYPPDGRTGANCLLGTKVMIPIDGPLRENVGLLGSPCFEIPRMVNRDKELLDGIGEDERRGRVRSKNLHKP
jgi:non-ribosomal peptide synthetase-like protein